MLEKFSKNAGFDFSDYVLHVGQRLRMDLPRGKKEYLELKGLVTYDKRRWEQDLLKGLKVRYGTKVDKASFPFNNYDYVLDCTGFHRSLLPRSPNVFVIPAYEYLLEKVEGEDEFFVIGYSGAKGYFWYFPLGSGRGYMGAGDTERKYLGIEEFFARHPEAQIVKKIGRPIRLAPPKRMEPFFDGNVIGVGESIGCVFPMLGEGIIPSLICCEIFLNVFGNGKPFNTKEYRERVLHRFKYYDDVYRIVRLKMEGKLSTIRHAGLMMSMYRNMKSEEQRFGFEVTLEKMNRLVNAL
jgi:flavin-dependent dehydrogenase